jgi:hypothetical protein
MVIPIILPDNRFSARGDHVPNRDRFEISKSSFPNAISSGDLKQIQGQRCGGRDRRRCDARK